MMSDEDDFDWDQKQVGYPANRVMNEANQRRSPQGQSPTATPIKQVNFRGIVKMRCMMFSGFFGDGLKQISILRIRDAYSGEGENTVEGIAIDGSPISILTGLEDATNDCPAFRSVHHRVQLRFSDIRASAVEALEANVAGKFDRKADLFAVNSYHGMAQVQCCLAKEAVLEDTEWLKADKRRRLILILDPNGPKYLPFDEVMQMLVGPLRSRVDVLIHVSAGAIKRVLGHAPAQKGMMDWFGRFEPVFVGALNMGDDAWIRVPLKGDSSQWTMMAYWAAPAPKGDWRAKGFVQLASDEGQAAVEYYSTLRKERAA